MARASFNFPTVTCLHFGFINLTHVKAPVNGGGDGADFGAQLLLDSSEGVAILVRDEVDGKTEVAKASRSADAVQVGLGVLGEVEVDNDVDGLDVDTAREQVRRDEVAGGAVAELVEDAVAVGLLHLGVDVVAGVSELGNLLGQELDAVDRVAEDDGLVDLELGEEGVEAVDLLPLFDVGVELGDAPEGQLLHEVDAVGIRDEFLAERLNRHGERGGEEADLMSLVTEVDDLLEDGLELRRQELVGLVHDDGPAFGQVGDLLGGQVEDAAGRRDDDVNGIVQTHDVILEGRSARGDHAVQAHVLANLFDNGRCLQRELARWDENEDCGAEDGGMRRVGGKGEHKTYIYISIGSDSRHPT